MRSRRCIMYVYGAGDRLLGVYAPLQIIASKLASGQRGRCAEL